MVDWHQLFAEVVSDRYIVELEGAPVAETVAGLRRQGLPAVTAAEDHRARIRTEQQRLDGEYRVRLWQCRVQEREIADLSTFDEIAACGLDPARIVEDDHSYCQDLGDELRNVGYRGVLAPSAALPGVVNLSLFGYRREIDEFEMAGEPNRAPDIFIPVTLLADDAAPPPDVLRYTRYQGDPHLSLLEWLAP